MTWFDFARTEEEKRPPRTVAVTRED